MQETEEMDQDELDRLINSLSNSSSDSAIETTENKKEIDNKNIDSSDDDPVMIKAMQEIKEDRDLAKKAFELFYPNIAADKDRSSASKEALMKAIELRIQANKNTVEILKIKKQKEVAQTGGVGIFINSKKSGIDINELKNSIDNED